MRRHSAIAATVLLATVSAFAAPGQAGAQVVSEPEQVLAPASAANGFAGWALAIEGDLLLVGAPGRRNGDSGTLYAYVREGGLFTLEQTISNPDVVSPTGDNFGWSVAIHTSTGGVTNAVVGAPGEGDITNPGAVYLLTYTASAAMGSRWAAPVRLAAPSPPLPALLGTSVAIDEAAIVAGAPDSGTSATIGGVVVWSRADLSSRVLVRAAAAGSDDRFGTSVAVRGDTLVVGAPGYDVMAEDAGAVFTLRRMRASWEAGPALLPPATAMAQLGTSVALSDDQTIVVAGAPEADPRGRSNAGAVYEFRRLSAVGVFGAATEIAPTDGAPSDNFGTWVALAGARLVVGAPNRDETPPATMNTGSAYLYERRSTSFVAVARYRGAADTAALGDELGQAVAIAGTTVVAGAPGVGMDVGAVMVYPVPFANGTDCALDGRCESGFCVDGVCCATACDGACEACGAGGACGAADESMACTASCGAAGVCSAGACSADCPDSGGIDPDSGTGIDGSTGMDGGARPIVQISGCACGVGRGQPVGAVFAVVAVLTALALRRRR